MKISKKNVSGWGFELGTKIALQRGGANVTPLPPMPQSPPRLHRPPSPLFPPIKPLLIPLVSTPPMPPYPQKITIPPPCHHNHNPPRPVLSTRPTSIPHHIAHSPTLVGCCSSGTVIATCPLLASRRTTAHHPQLAVVTVHHASLLTAKATQASPSPIFLEKDHVHRGGLSTRLDSGVGQYQAAAKKKENIMMTFT